MATYYKIRRKGEAFWCELMETLVPNSIYQVRVANHIGNEFHNLKLNDRVNIRRTEIMDTMVLNDY